MGKEETNHRKKQLQETLVNLPHVVKRIFLPPAIARLGPAGASGPGGMALCLYLCPSAKKATAVYALSGFTNYIAPMTGGL